MVRNKVLVSRETLKALSEGRVKYNPELKVRFGRYVVRRPKALVKWIGGEGEG